MKIIRGRIRWWYVLVSCIWKPKIKPETNREKIREISALKIKLMSGENTTQNNKGWGGIGGDMLKLKKKDRWKLGRKLSAEKRERKDTTFEKNEQKICTPSSNFGKKISQSTSLNRIHVEMDY